MIVKVQLPLYTVEKTPEALVHSKDHSVEFFAPVTPELLKAMRGELKAFFYLDHKKGAESPSLYERAPNQDW